MIQQEIIVNALKEKFANIAASIIIQRPRRIFLEVSQAQFLEVFDYCVKEIGFPHLCTITGLDEIEKFGLIYHLAQDNGNILNIKTSVPKERPVLKTITGYYAGAEIYERELVDLFGIEVEGLPEGNRYPLPDDWPKGQFPLRKDWNSKSLENK